MQGRSKTRSKVVPILWRRWEVKGGLRASLGIQLKREAGTARDGIVIILVVIVLRMNECGECQAE